MARSKSQAVRALKNRAPLSVIITLPFPAAVESVDVGMIQVCVVVVAATGSLSVVKGTIHYARDEVKFQQERKRAAFGPLIR